MLTLNQLLNFEEKTEDGTTHRLSIKTSNFGDKNTDYEISGLMPVKIDIKAKMDIHGIKFNLMDLLHKYAKEKHGSRDIVINKIKFPKDQYLKDYKIIKETEIQFFTEDEDYVPDPDFVESDSDYITFNVLYSYHRHTKEHSDKMYKIRNKENKNKKEK